MTPPHGQPLSPSLERGLPVPERLLLIGGDERLRTRVRDRYTEWDVAAAATPLAGIHALCRHSCRAVLMYVDSEARRLEPALAGLREAAGADTPLILCCPPEAEPLARRGVAAGASNYLVCPLNDAELDRAVGYARPEPRTPRIWDSTPTASMDELARLGALLADLPKAGRTLLSRLADLVRAALDGAAVRLVVEGTVVEAGEVGTDPVLVEPLQVDGRLLGQVSLGLRPNRPYTSADAEKLRHYAGLVGQVLKAAGTHRRWRDLALTDELSGLPNRRALLQFLADVLERAERERFCVTILLFDIDDFKRYNDTCGHDAGDEIIRVVGKLIKRHCREHDVVGRYGGDEFAVVFWDAERPRVAGSRHPDDAMIVLRRFTEALSAHEFTILKHTGPCQLTVSGGLATFPWDGKTADDLITRADQALLQAKREGKNRILHLKTEP